MNQNGTNDSKAPRDPLRLVVMFDGLANTRESMTNVSRMFEAIDDSLPDSYKCIGSGANDLRPHFAVPAFTKTVQCGKCNQPMLEPVNYEGDDSKAYFRAGVPCGSCHQLVVEPTLQRVQKVKYIPGVGTHKLVGWITGQTFGYGLSEKIKEGYTWLCQNYQEGDDVFVFGFSRGAFAARSLVSLLHKCHGVLTKTRDSGNLKRAIKNAYAFYSEGKDRKDFEDYLSKHENGIKTLDVRVKMLGVWDTVSAVGNGFPTGLSIIDNSRLVQYLLSPWSWSRVRYHFHDQRLSSIVDNAYHALALDERRGDFEPTLWMTRAFEKQEVKQVWFVGSHCNVGGGADLEDNVDPDDLWQYSYVWMQRHAEKHGLRFYWSYESPPTRQANSHLLTRRVSLREPEPSYENFGWGLYNKFFKPVDRKPIPELAMLHWSVLERIKVTIHDPNVQRQDLAGKKWKPYRPGSLGNLCSHEFLETVIPEGSTPDHVDAKGTRGVAARTWHIETDDVMTCKQWRLPVVKNETLGKKELTNHSEGLTEMERRRKLPTYLYTSPCGDLL